MTLEINNGDVIRCAAPAVKLDSSVADTFGPGDKGNFFVLAQTQNSPLLLLEKNIKGCRVQEM